jgi:hypothetical protein
MKRSLTLLALVAAFGAGLLAAGCSDMSGGGTSPSMSAKPAGGGY